MSAFLVATVSIKSPEKLQEYAKKSGETIILFGGEIIAKGKAAGALSGDLDHQMIAIAKFPDMESLDNWYQSDEYQAIIPLRNEGADMTIIKYAVPT